MNSQPENFTLTNEINQPSLKGKVIMAFVVLVTILLFDHMTFYKFLEINYNVIDVFRLTIKK